MATRQQCKWAIDTHEDELMSRANVVGIGVVPSGDEIAASKASTLVVAVYVSRKVPLDQLGPGDVVPKSLAVVSRGQRVYVPTKVIEQGTVELETPGLDVL